MESVLGQGREVLSEFYEMDLKGLASAQTRPLPDDFRGPLAKFWTQLRADVAERPNPAERAAYLAKVGALFFSYGFHLSTTFRLGKLAARPGLLRRAWRPWLPVLGAMLGARLFARLLARALPQIPHDSPDYPLAQFLRANFELMANGGGVGIGELPDFVREAAEDPALRLIQELLKDLEGDEQVRRQDI